MARPVGTEKNGIKYLDEHQLAQFIKAKKKAKDLRYDVMFSLILRYGMRVSECTNLKLKNILFDTKGIQIKGMKDGVQMTYNRMDDELWRKLEKYLKIRYKGMKEDEDSFIFPSPIKRGYPISVQSVKMTFKKYARLAGLSSDFSIHSLRHTAGMILAKSNAPVIFIKDFLRQKTLTSTLHYLQKIAFDEQQEKTNKLFEKFS